jgi:trans-aconitate methyltransferase
MTEWNASDYHQQATLQQVLAEEHLARLTLAGSEQILDIGCGDGRVTAEIAARVPRGSVVGIDPSRDMIAYASSHFGPPGHPNLRFEVADVRRLPFRHEFDLVVSFNALHWVPEQDAALRAIATALKPGGRTLLQFVPAGARKCIEDVIEDTRRSARWASYFTGFHQPYVHFTPEEYRALAERNGLRVIRIQTEEKAWDFRTRAAFFAWCHATFAEWTRCLPEAEWAAFINDVLDRYRAVAADKPGEENTFKFYQMEVVLTPA